MGRSYHTGEVGPNMEMVVVDWTRMGKTFCIAGVTPAEGGLRVVRPLPTFGRNAPVRNIGWPVDFLAGHCRWEAFELVGPSTPPPEPPHLEDLWVQNLRPLRRLAPPSFRRDVLTMTQAPQGCPIFGTPLTCTRSTAYLEPNTGCRSLGTIVVEPEQVRFRLAIREGAADWDYRVELDIPALAGRSLAVKDHFLLERAELASTQPAGREQALTLALRQMGPRVAVRLGLSRAFQGTANRSSGLCYLMADGFFSLADPQP
jgi:hypothetical protein